MNNVKEICLVLENCDSITFPANVIGDFRIEKINEEVERIAINCIAKVIYANSIFIEIYKDGNIEYAQFGFLEDQIKKFERLKDSNDITSIEIKYEDDTVDSYFVDYDESNDGLGAPNINEKTYISSYGNLYIVIDKEKELKDFVNLEEIEDEKHMNYFHKIWDIGIEKEKVHNISTSCLPELYRFVYVMDDLSHQELAIRVMENGVSRFIYDDPKQDIYPTKWQYPTKSIDKFLKKEYRDKNFNPYKLKKEFKNKN